MKQGKHVKSPSKKHLSGRRSAAFLIAVVLLVTLAVGGTFAILKLQTPAVSNTFTSAGAATPSIVETFTEGGTVKSDVKVALNGDGSGTYNVRAVILYSFQDEEGNTVAKVPVAGDDYSVSIGSGWTLGSDGFYYYNSTLVPGGSTSNLINSCTTLNSEYKLVVDILAQTVQTGGASAEWNYLPDA